MASTSAAQAGLGVSNDFLTAYDASAFPHPSRTVDVVVMTVRDHRLCALLARRTAPPQ